MVATKEKAQPVRISTLNAAIDAMLEEAKDGLIKTPDGAEFHAGILPAEWATVCEFWLTCHDTGELPDDEALKLAVPIPDSDSTIQDVFDAMVLMGMIFQNARKPHDKLMVFPAQCLGALAVWRNSQPEPQPFIPGHPDYAFEIKDGKPDTRLLTQPDEDSTKH